MRDEFTEAVKRAVAGRVGNRCSNPECKAATSGPQVDPSKLLSVGVAAHITAASPGGPRFDASLSPEDRKHAENAIWLCQNCAKLVDNDPERFTENVLRRWKEQAEAEALINIGKTAIASDGLSRDLGKEEIEILIWSADDGEIKVYSPDQIDKWVHVGQHDFRDEFDSAVAEVYIEALNLLIQRKLVRHDKEIAYKLTGTGFKIARKLRDLLPSWTVCDA